MAKVISLFPAAQREVGQREMGRSASACAAPVLGPSRADVMKQVARENPVSPFTDEASPSSLVRAVRLSRAGLPQETILECSPTTAPADEAEGPGVLRRIAGFTRRILHSLAS